MRANADQRENCRIGYSGNVLHWEDLDEDISVEALLSGRGDKTCTGLQVADRLGQRSGTTSECSATGDGGLTRGGDTSFSPTMESSEAKRPGT